mmetsp:Transcript_32257/g.84244  ORF Transcript_32257/g.84244 Transcript_32257/m.84244 type:complete len:1109 (+) Transcript_32257:1714-5040(+)
MVLMLFAGNTNKSMQTTAEKVIASGIMLAGSGILAIMVSQVGVILTTLQADHREYGQKLNSINVMMRKLKLPVSLRQRIEQYYFHMSHSHGSFDVLCKLNNDLSNSLVNEMSIFFHRRMIAKVPMFAECSVEVIQAVVKRLVAELYLEGDFIMRAGMPSSAMCFISYGRCSVLLDDPKRADLLYRVRTLSRHEYFGELSLVHEKHVPATAHILAENNVGIFALYRSDFEDVKQDHPELLSEILKAVGRAQYHHAHKNTSSEVQHESAYAESNAQVLRAFCSVRMQLSVHTDLNPFMIQEVVDACEQTGFHDMEQILKMRDPPAGIYFILEGCCLVTIPSLTGDGTQESVKVLNPGEFFGDISLVFQQPVSANVAASGSCLCSVLFPDQYEMLKFRHPELEQFLRSATSKRSYQQLTPFLKPPSIVQNMSTILARALVARLSIESIAAGELVLSEGEPHDGMFILAQGELEVEVRLIPTVEGRRARSLQLFEISEPRHSVIAPLEPGGACAGTPASELPAWDTGSASGSQESSPDKIPNRRVSFSRVCMSKERIASMCRSHGLDEDTSPSGENQVNHRWSFHADYDNSEIPERDEDKATFYDQSDSFVSSDVPQDVPQGSGTKLVKIYREGDSLGETAALHPGAKPTAAIRARTACELCTLSSAAVQELMLSFPELEEELRQHEAASDYTLCTFLSTNTALFADADVELVTAAARALEPIQCEPGQQLITMGSASVGLFIVFGGECPCLIADPEDPSARKTVATKRPGEIFGELALLEPGRATAADVVAGEHTEVLLLTPDKYAELQAEHSEFRRLLVSTMPSYATYNFFFELPIFRNASHEFLQELLGLVKQEQHNAGTVLQQAAKDGSAAYFVQKGQFSATADSFKPVTLKEGNYFGLECAVGMPTSRNVVAQMDVQVWRLSSEDCQALAAKHSFFKEEAEALHSRGMLDAAFPERENADDEPEGAAGAQDASDMNGSFNGQLDQRMRLMQSTMLSMNREFQTRLDGLESKVFDTIEHNDRRRQKTLEAMLDRINLIAESVALGEHPSRATRSSRVSFAPKQGATAGTAAAPRGRNNFQFSPTAPAQHALSGSMRAVSESALQGSSS